MNRPRLNFYLDWLAFLVLFSTVVTGLVLRLALPPGSGRLEAGGPDRPVLTLWGLTRHEWGTVHYAVSLAFLAVLALHVWLHRAWIGSLMRRESSRDAGKFFTLGLVACFALLVVGLSPLWSQPVDQSRSQVLAQRGETPADGAVCYTEGSALSGSQLEQITGVPQGQFEQASRSRPLTAAQARQLVLSHYGVARPDQEGERLFQMHCSGCHSTAAALPDLGSADQAALARLRQARPAQAHQSLKTMSESQLRLLLDYLRGKKVSQV
ncbi:DUF4405 domain-containing protein [bacterium]|nr:DUF4405 domain-containing protein [bacterium]